MIYKLKKTSDSKLKNLLDSKDSYLEKILI